MSQVKEVKFNKFIIDMEKNNEVVLSFTDSNGEEEKIDIGKYVSINLNEDMVDIKIKDSEKWIKSTLNTYSKSLLFLVKNLEVKAILKNLFEKEENAEKEYFVVESRQNALVGEKISKLDVQLNILNELEAQKEMSKSTQKNNLKVYETPTNMFDIVFSLMERIQIRDNFLSNKAIAYKSELISKLSRKIESSLDNKARTKELKELISVFKNKNSTGIFLKVFESFSSEAKKHRYEVEENENYLKIRDYILDTDKETVDRIKLLSESEHPYTLLDDKELTFFPRIPIMDFQAGSGKAILESASKASFPFQLQGLEFRSIENLGLDSDNLDSRYNVESGRNFNIYKNDLENAFSNGKNFKAIINTPIYLNPPYNADNQIAKESVEILADKQLVFGLFPTSMKNFLAERLDGYIFEVNKELTGYKDKEVPEKLLFVVGRRHEDALITADKDNLFVSRQKHTFLRNIGSNTISGAIKEIEKEINLNSAKFPFAQYISSVNEYFKLDESRVDLLMRTVRENVQKTDNFVKNSSVFFEALEGNSEYIRNQFGSENMLLKEKVFPDVQFYEKDGKTEYHKFYDVVSNQGLLVAYRDNYPEILKLIQNIAKKESITLPMNESFTSLYDLSNPHKPTIKDKKVSENIGLMKNYYLPSSFDLSKKENKENLLLILEDIHTSKNATFDAGVRSALKNIISKASRLVTKLETNIRDERSVLKDELFVFIDSDGVNIGKLNVSKTDFYKSLESLNFFNIDDYVELAVLKDDKKEIVMENFLKHIKNCIHLLDKYNKTTNCEERTFKYLNEAMALKKQLKENVINESEYAKSYNSLFIKFADEFNVFNYFNSFINYDSKLVGKFDSFFLKNEYLLDIKPSDRKNIANDIYGLYSESPLNFFEYKRVATEEKIGEIVNDVMREKNLPLLNEKQLKLMKIDIFNNLSQDFIRRKSIFEAGIRLSRLIVMNYGYATIKKSISAKKGIELSYSKLYDELFDNISLNTLGLMPHQHTTSERFLEISDETKLDMKAWEMRSGKTLGLAYGMYLLSLYNSEDAFMFLESKNVDDISLQILSHLPHLFVNSNFYLTESNINTAIVSSNKAYSHLPLAEYYTNIPSILKKYYVGRGDMTKDEIEVFGVEFEDLIKQVEEKDWDKNYILENYKDSKFLEVLNISCMKNA